MEQTGAQQVFFQHIRNTLPPHISLVDEIAELLNISTDSAYRRIRGEKLISFDEIRTLCSHFKISLDQLFYLNSESIIFSGGLTNNKNYGFDIYLQNILDHLININSFERRELISLNKDIIFHDFNFHDLTSFRLFFWMKTVLQYPLFGKALFDSDDFTESLHQTVKKIMTEYNKIPSQEIWNMENIQSIIYQIEYYKETKVFASAQDILNLYECLLKTVDHIERQAEAGYKFQPGGKPLQTNATYKLYVNEFILGDNTIVAVLNDLKVVYIPHTVLNYLHTKDTAFAEYTYQHFQNIIRKSTLISDVGEKERSRFFNTMREKIDDHRKSALQYNVD
ncbi:MAG TPA: hypothetical protein VMH01_13095 [Puia sp.]|nr:hypothetical protein [Puia sp.]